MKTYRYYIGIDTGTNTGLCIWNAEGKFIRAIETWPIHRALTEVKSWADFETGNIFVRLEDARLRRWIPKQNNERAERGRREGAGYVKAHAQIWEQFLTDYQIPFELVAPKNNKTKVTQAYFNKLTGFTGKCSEHARDAAMLVIGF
jgi:hypothetical protein